MDRPSELGPETHIGLYCPTRPDLCAVAERLPTWYQHVDSRNIRTRDVTLKEPTTNINCISKGRWLQATVGQASRRWEKKLPSGSVNDSMQQCQLDREAGSDTQWSSHPNPIGKEENEWLKGNIEGVGFGSCLGVGVEPNSWREVRAVTRLGGAVDRGPGDGQIQFTGAGHRRRFVMQQDGWSPEIENSGVEDSVSTIWNESSRVLHAGRRRNRQGRHYQHPYHRQHHQHSPASVDPNDGSDEPELNGRGFPHLKLLEWDVWRCKFVGSEETGAGPAMPNRGQLGPECWQPMLPRQEPRWSPINDNRTTQARFDSNGCRLARRVAQDRDETGTSQRTTDAMAAMQWLHGYNTGTSRAAGCGLQAGYRLTNRRLVQFHHRNTIPISQPRPKIGRPDLRETHDSVPSNNRQEEHYWLSFPLSFLSAGPVPFTEDLPKLATPKVRGSSSSYYTSSRAAKQPPAPSASASSSKPKMGSHIDADPTQAVDGLVRAIRDLTSDPNYKLVADVFSEFLYVKEQNNKLSSSHQVVLEEYRKFRNELEEQKGELVDEKNDLEHLVQEKVQEIIQLSATRTRLEGDLEDTQKALEEKIAAAAEAAATAAQEYANLQDTTSKAYADLEAKAAKEHSDLQEKTAKEYADLEEKKDKEYADLDAAKAAVEEEKRLGEEAAAAAAAQAADEIAALTEAKTGLEEVKANNEAEIESLKGNVADLETARADLEQVKADNEAEIASLKEQIATLEGEKKGLEEELEAARQEIASLNETIVQKNNEIESLQESLRAAEEQIASLQQTVEDKNAEIEDLHGKLTAEGERANSAEAHGRDLQSQLDETTQSLQLTTRKLTNLEQYRLVLHSENDDTYVTVLDKIWTTIVTLVEGTFRPDIDEQTLNDPSCWTNLRNSPYLKHATQLQIPLPQSNTPAAKGMRISAVLAVLSRAMHKHLFRPVYLLDDDDENLVKFLRALEDEDPTREAHMRATLVAMMPERQVEQGARRVKMVVREVSWLVQHLLTALQFEAFCSGLEAACKLACEQWMRIQLAQMKIEPYFGPPYDDFDWQVLELPEFAEAAEANAGHPRDDGDDFGDDRLETIEASEVGRAPSDTAGGAADAGFHDGGGGNALRHGHGHDEELMDGEVDPDEILLVVWPSMCAVENGELMSITQGLVISKEQARPALEEQRTRSRIIPRPGSRRARTLSMPGQSRGSSPTRGKPTTTHFLAQSVTASDLDGPDDI
ncbi:hypothetical protein CHGG_05097 [Chaetomium globosum CBS 148.51]|uniref:Uncharacterized protein n=1 Tax=Chaetomium globosum (strain ATCC 6205 / CBS 148.51 / DSM 1962 / NBRC 6347 / NRRL 1970) TaxID=306901 RepID=Q2GZE9_CHAGB|nr:uncharacterized protein CHGG_05097 [Chaetomium globosum CBS 148.51]EAQ88478.1 hypothetical protein CHGG_05097 [Chaetomium globosum CBS 148.51]